MVVKAHPGTVVLAFDASNSMLADDLEPTASSRQTAAQAFIDNQPDNIEIGVVAFSLAGWSQQPRTTARVQFD